MLAHGNVRCAVLAHDNVHGGTTTRMVVRGEDIQMRARSVCIPSRVTCWRHLQQKICQLLVHDEDGPFVPPRGISKRLRLRPKRRYSGSTAIRCSCSRWWCWWWWPRRQWQGRVHGASTGHGTTDQLPPRSTSRYLIRSVLPDARGLESRSKSRHNIIDMV